LIWSGWRSSLDGCQVERIIMTTSASAVTYQICLGVRLTPDRANWFDEMTLTFDDAGQTIMTGALPDQAALHGVLAKVRDLGLPLISVTRLTSV
jgi:hypothetical protein